MKPSLNMRISRLKYHLSKFSLPNQSTCRTGLDAYFYFNLFLFSAILPYNLLFHMIRNALKNLTVLFSRTLKVDVCRS